MAAGDAATSNGSTSVAKDGAGTPWLYIVPISREALEKYASWLPGRARRPFVPPEHAVLVGMKDPADPNDAGVLVSGVGLFPTSGVFLMVEQFATNPDVPARVRHAACAFTFEAVRIHAAIVGKLPFFITSTLGLYRMAKKAGWVPHARAAVLEADPLHPVMPIVRRGQLNRAVKITAAAKVPKKKRATSARAPTP